MLFGWLDFFMQDNDAKCLLSEHALVKVIAIFTAMDGDGLLLKNFAPVCLLA